MTTSAPKVHDFLSQEPGSHSPAPPLSELNPDPIITDAELAAFIAEIDSYEPCEKTTSPPPQSKDELMGSANSKVSAWLERQGITPQPKPKRRVNRGSKEAQAIRKCLSPWFNLNTPHQKQAICTDDGSRYWRWFPLPGHKDKKTGKMHPPSITSWMIDEIINPINPLSAIHGLRPNTDLPIQLICIDLDAHHDGQGTAKEANEAATYLRDTYFPGAYIERSSGGRGYNLLLKIIKEGSEDSPKSLGNFTKEIRAIKTILASRGYRCGVEVQGINTLISLHNIELLVQYLEGNVYFTPSLHLREVINAADQTTAEKVVVGIIPNSSIAAECLIERSVATIAGAVTGSSPVNSTDGTAAPETREHLTPRARTKGATANNARHRRWHRTGALDEMVKSPNGRTRRRATLFEYRNQIGRDCTPEEVTEHYENSGRATGDTAFDHHRRLADFKRLIRKYPYDPTKHGHGGWKDSLNYVSSQIPKHLRTKEQSKLMPVMGILHHLHEKEPYFGLKGIKGCWTCTVPQRSFISFCQKLYLEGEIPRPYNTKDYTKAFNLLRKGGFIRVQDQEIYGKRSRFLNKARTVICTRPKSLLISLKLLSQAEYHHAQRESYLKEITNLTPASTSQETKQVVTKLLKKERQPPFPVRLEEIGSSRGAQAAVSDDLEPSEEELKYLLSIIEGSEPTSEVGALYT